MQYIRPPQVAGYFYPAEPLKLQREINLMLDICKSKFEAKNIFGIVAPHAGYIYSGKTAAFAYNAIKGKNYKTVIVISPSHSEYFPGISIFDGDAYQTPLGVLKVDKELSEKLLKQSKVIHKGQEGHRREHALEVQLPFLQSVLKDFKIVPVVMGDQTKLYVDELANAIAKSVDENTLIVVSSDLSHFHNKMEANELDSIVEDDIINMNPEKLMEDLAFNNCEACGGGPIAVMMKAAKLKNIKSSTVLHRSDSGDTTGDNREVVGYLSAVVYGD